MSGHAFDVTDADFEAKVVAASINTLVLVDFWAPWCQPCRVLKPLLEKLADEFGGRFLLAKVNSDENPEAARRYGVRGIPAVKAFVGGQLVDEFAGALPERQVREFIERHLPSPAEPLRVAAKAARDAGDIETARHLLNDALQLDAHHPAVCLDAASLCLDENHLDEAGVLLERAAAKSRDRAAVDALRARLDLAKAVESSGNATDTAALEAALAATPDDHASRLALANALALAGDYRGALEHQLWIVQSDRKWNDEAARKAMLNLFNMLGGSIQHTELVREFRVKLARTLN